MPNTLAESYEQLPYRSFARRSSRPEHLAVIGRLFGITAPDPSSSRVLEIGCGTGGNLIPLAEAYPRSTFIGIDLARGHIDEASGVARALALTNVTFAARDVTTLTREDGGFDYILCHGVYSWVPEVVRDAILRVCSENLNENGLAFVSYNAKPGGSFRAAVRDVMRYHSNLFGAPEKQLEEATDLIRFLSRCKTGASDSYRTALKEVLVKLESSQPDYLFHDFLGEESEPYLLSDFVVNAERAGLSYVGDASPELMFDTAQPEDVRRVLSQFASDRIRFQQYLDFVENRAFRESVLARAKPELPGWGRLADARFASSLTAMPPAGARAWFTFKDNRGRDVRVDDDGERDVLVSLTAAWPSSLSERDVCPGRDRGEVSRALRSLFERGLVEAELFPRRATGVRRDLPRTSEYARYLATRQAVVTSPLHYSAPLSSPARVIVALMDGKTEIERIDSTLRELLDDGDKDAAIARAWREVIDHGFLLGD
jgi:SAM-dependent methyltransferase